MDVSTQIINETVRIGGIKDLGLGSRKASVGIPTGQLPGGALGAEDRNATINKASRIT